MSELDDVRKTKLLNLIQGKVQTFLTSTSIDGVHHQVIDMAKNYDRRWTGERRKQWKRIK